MGQQPLRVLLLGYGLAGRVFHARLIDAEPDLEVTGIVTSNDQRREQVRTERPTAALFATDAEAWTRSDEFDVAVVATANSAHVPQTQAALRNGLHVVVDKPLAGSAAQAQELIDLAQEMGRQLHVFQNRRWDSEILTARGLLDSGALGVAHRLESRFERWRPALKGGWREVGPPEDLPGQAYDLGSHLVDQAIHLLGPVTRVVGSVRAVREGATADDDVQAMLWHSSGAVSILSMSMVAAFKEPRLRLLGTRGGLEIVGLDTQEDALLEGLSPRHEDWGLEPPDAVALFMGAEDSAPTSIERSRGAWPEYYAGVVRAIRDGAPPPVDTRDVVANLRVIEAIVLSADDNRVVELNPPAAHV